MVQTLSKPLTLDEFLDQTETKPASEYIDGQIIQKPMPQGEHSVIQGEMVTTANAALKPNKIARAFPELRCTFGGRSIVPDVSVFLWDRIPRKENGGVANRFMLAPDWATEILSPDQSQTKLIKKLLHCLENGTEMGWLIDPEEKTIFVFQSQQPPVAFDEPEQIILVPSFASELRLSVGELFGWLLE
ncbi:Uma2 family endonuclease [Limnofasciculus baicalensis]|uniref:Uma2 family endonuclease n=1 Tax=Limnofasciculus baicalensis BBK-W-15 TaxID=2699891 RepID=A0AAE3GVG9_9CYAN|nr:Uma2 family endonuclease [Limnofasciculus baicalensis]MCP2731209.1 Uma2 family endonuclease [Limnofasciculus baicalensis BBK-W-15]